MLNVQEIQTLVEILNRSPKTNGEIIAVQFIVDKLIGELESAQKPQPEEKPVETVTETN